MKRSINFFMFGFWLFCIVFAARAQNPSPPEDILLPVTFEPLSVGEIKPAGWLKKQLRIQAQGLSGHLDEFWPDVAQSGWIGGNAEGWERAPYWLDGVVPLAYILDDGRLKAKVRRWMDYILTHQQPDGWLGPVQDKDKWPYDPWPTFIILKAMAQYAEAENDERVIPAMLKCCGKLNRRLDEKPLFDWSAPRWGELLVSIYWLYERKPEPWLLELAAKIHEQGSDWPGHFADFQYQQKLDPEHITYLTHGVNNAMALKTYPLWYRQSHNPEDRNRVFDFMRTLDRYHGQATGVFTCDEHLAGTSPSQGTELCMIVEYMYSLETLMSLLGEVQFGDRLERIAFNNLPAAFKPDMWAHQFDQQANQVVCKSAGPVVYTINGPDSNVFGLEPCFGCCTANMHQGWPKFVTHLWMRHYDSGGLAAVAYAPCSIRTTIGKVPVEITVKTDYPFRDTILINVKTAEQICFPLYLRIPGWTRNPQVTIEKKELLLPEPGTFCRIQRQWKGTSRLKLCLPMPVKTQRRYHNSVSLERGPLVYSLKVDERWQYLKGQRPHADWEVYPVSDWNYAIAIDPDNPADSVTFRNRRLGSAVFTPQGAPVEAAARGRKLPPWKIESNAAGPVPQSPVESDEPLEKLTLIPYGCTHLRVTEFPLLKQTD